MQRERLKIADSVLLRLFMRDNVALSASRENSSNQSLHLHRLAIILEFRIKEMKVLYYIGREVCLLFAKRIHSFSHDVTQS